MTPPLIPDRACDSCSLCCKLLGIQAFRKPPGQMCPNCLPEQGCGIYSERPDECAAFHCAWRLWPALGPHWFPADSHLMVIVSPSDRRIVIKVDPAHPDAWTREPFYREIKMMAAQMMPRGFQVGVQVNQNIILVRPDRNIDLGPVAV